MTQRLRTTPAPPGDQENQENVPPFPADLYAQWRKRHASTEANPSQAFSKRIMSHLPGQDVFQKAMGGIESTMFHGPNYEPEDDDDDDDGMFHDRSRKEQFYEAMSARLDRKLPEQDLDWLLESIPLEDRAKETVDISETVMVFH